MLADCMLLFQVGDFYEFFGDDARRAAHVNYRGRGGIFLLLLRFAASSYCFLAAALCMLLATQLGFDEEDQEGAACAE